MPSRYPLVYPELFVGLSASRSALALQIVGSTHDGHLRSRQDMADAITRANAILARQTQLKQDRLSPRALASMATH